MMRKRTVWSSAFGLLRRNGRIQTRLKAELQAEDDKRMNASNYRWREMSDEERKICLAERKAERLPWHRPPHFEAERTNRYLITAACYEHKPIIGLHTERMARFEKRLREISNPVAWVVLPNHYHILVEYSPIKSLFEKLGKLHGRCSFEWNAEDGTRGRKVFHGSTERHIRSKRHHEATINYIHHNPVKHGYTNQWHDWPFSSVHEYFEIESRNESLKRWRDYPLGNYGEAWDKY